MEFGNEREDDFGSQGRGHDLEFFVFGMMANPNPCYFITFGITYGPIMNSYSQRPKPVSNRLKMEGWMRWILFPEKIILFRHFLNRFWQRVVVLPKRLEAF